MPERKASAKEASRQVGAVDDTAKPIAAPNASRTNASPAPQMAPAKTEPQPTPTVIRSAGWPAVSAPMSTMGTSPQSKKGEDCHDNHDETDQINKSVHHSLRRQCPP